MCNDAYAVHYHELGMATMFPALRGSGGFAIRFSEGASGEVYEGREITNTNTVLVHKSIIIHAVLLCTHINI